MICRGERADTEARPYVDHRLPQLVQAGANIELRCTTKFQRQQGLVAPDRRAGSTQVLRAGNTSTACREASP